MNCIVSRIAAVGGVNKIRLISRLSTGKLKVGRAKQEVSSILPEVSVVPESDTTEVVKLDEIPNVVPVGLWLTENRELNNKIDRIMEMLSESQARESKKENIHNVSVQQPYITDTKDSYEQKAEKASAEPVGEVGHQKLGAPAAMAEDVPRISEVENIHLKAKIEELNNRYVNLNNKLNLQVATIYSFAFAAYVFNKIV